MNALTPAIEHTRPGAGGFADSFNGALEDARLTAARGHQRRDAALWTIQRGL